MESNIISLINEGRGSNIPPKSKNFGHSPLSIVEWIIPFHSSIQHGIKTYFSFLMLTLLLIFSTVQSVLMYNQGTTMHFFL